MPAHPVLIPRTTRAEPLEENVGALALKLTEGDWADVTVVMKRFPTYGARYPEAMMKFVDVR
jgi:diketogulonate reductase-like aldo/keto reductase